MTTTDFYEKVTNNVKRSITSIADCGSSEFMLPLTALLQKATALNGHEQKELYYVLYFHMEVQHRVIDF